MAKWEYLVVEVASPYSPDTATFKINGGERQRGDQWLADNIPDELNKLGEEGGELIKIGKANTLHWSVMYTFKRPL